MPVPPLTIITRIGGGRRQVIDGSPATFGRDASNTLVVGGQFTSRKHGTLVYEDEQWQLTNQSPNGTQVNGKKVGRKPRALADRDVISVNDEVIFEVRIEPAGESPAADTTGTAFDEAPATASQGMSGRTKIWIGIGIYMVLICLLFVYLTTLREERAAAREHTQPLTRQEIAAEIRAAVPVLEPNERAYREQLQAAKEMVNRLEANPDSLYEAYQHYARALALSGQRDLPDGLAQRQFLDIRQRLTDKVADTYSEAYERLRSNQFRSAIRGFQRVRDLYPDHTSRIHRNATLQRKIASDGYAQQKRRGR